MNLGDSPTNRNQMTKTKMETSQLHTNTGGVLRCFILDKKVKQYIMCVQKTMSWTQFLQVMNLGASTTNRNQMTKTKAETSQLHTNTGGALGWIPVSSGIKKEILCVIPDKEIQDVAK
ncbi:hypothetical protein CDAR_4281 [Caerostris darwini]|uniref:Uncharacterized protein n=1 Tax=Caerostris darwini TaxID=1538125 RepID=A0AAV4SHG3_9ARAC|nr:hypothetical protein CDAR_4281 [Caerostris darwini]